MKSYSKKEKEYWYNESQYQKKLYQELKEREVKREEHQELLKEIKEICEEYKRGVIWKSLEN